MIDKIRLWLLKKLIRDTDGYTYTGFSEGQPIKFYYKEDTGEYLLGARHGRFYYGRPGLSGWSYGMSKHLDWGKDTLLGVEPKEIDFNRWIHGILENIFKQYKSTKKSA